MDRLIRWLRDRLPESPAPTLVHNDYKLDNMMLDAKDPSRVEAVLDWEMATVGDPLVDLGCVMCYWPEAGDPPVRRDALSAITTLPGWFTRAQLVERYARITGRDVSGLGYYEVFGIFKIAVVLQQIYFRYPPRADAGRALSQLRRARARTRGDRGRPCGECLRRTPSGSEVELPLSDPPRPGRHARALRCACRIWASGRPTCWASIWLRRRVPFKAFIAGCLNRQRQTAEEVWRAYREAGVAVPDIVSEPTWNEFDMTAVFSEFAPLLSEADPRFKQDYQELLRKLEDAARPSIKPGPTAIRRRCAPGWKAAIRAARNPGRRSASAS
jgi:hypothetical protein